MNITISNEANTQTVILPVVLQEMDKLKQGYKTETFETLKGDLTLVGNKELREFPISSFFPVNKKYSFIKAGALENGWDYIDFLNENLGKPVRLVITTEDKHTFLNMLAIYTFEHLPNKIGNIDYTINFKEFKIDG